jgi:hypothetical protein
MAFTAKKSHRLDDFYAKTAKNVKNGAKKRDFSPYFRYFMKKARINTVFTKNLVLSL